MKSECVWPEMGSFIGQKRSTCCFSFSVHNPTTFAFAGQSTCPRGPTERSAHANQSISNNSVSSRTTFPKEAGPRCGDDNQQACVASAAVHSNLECMADSASCRLLHHLMLQADELGNKCHGDTIDIVTCGLMLLKLPVYIEIVQGGLS